MHTIGERVGLEDAVLPLVQDLLRCGLLMSPGVDGGTADSLYATPDALSEELRATWLGAELFSRLENEAGELNYWVSVGSGSQNKSRSEALCL